MSGTLIADTLGGLDCCCPAPCTQGCFECPETMMVRLSGQAGTLFNCQAGAGGLACECEAPSPVCGTPLDVTSTLVRGVSGCLWTTGNANSSVCACGDCVPLPPFDGSVACPSFDAPDGWCAVVSSLQLWCFAWQGMQFWAVSFSYNGTWKRELPGGGDCVGPFGISGTFVLQSDSLCPAVGVYVPSFQVGIPNSVLFWGSQNLVDVSFGSCEVF